MEEDSDLDLKAKIVVFLIARMERPEPDPKNLKVFNDEVNKWAAALDSIWCRSENPQDAMFSSLLVVYEAISTASPPNSSLAAVLQLVPSNVIVQASRALVLAPESSPEGLTKTLQALCDWLIVAPKATHLPTWIKALVDALCRDGKNEVVTDVASNVVEKLMSVLHLHFLRPGALAALQCLIGFSHPSINKTCIEERIPALIIQLQSENSPSSAECIKWLMGVQQIGADFTAPQKVGLLNLGNTCYMNSVLQALFSSSQFCADILACSSARPVSCRLQEVFALLRFSRRPAITPREFMLVSCPSGFNLGYQQDGSEFLIHLLDTIHEEENGAVSVQESDSSLASETLARSRSRSLSPTASPGHSKPISLRRVRSADEISSLSIPFRRCRKISKFNGLTQRSFGGKMLTVFRCHRCFSESQNIDPFIDMQVSFPRQCQTPQTIQNLIDDYFKPEMMTGENRYRCDKCKTLCDAQRTLQMVEMPANLIITVKLFGSNPPTKLRHKLSHAESIRLPGDVAYKLYAAIVHRGNSLHSGHYLTYASDANAAWHLYDDAQVMPSSFAELSRCVAPRTPYVLFFSRSSTPPLDMFPTVAQLPARLREMVAQDNAAFTQGLRDEEERRRRRNAVTNLNNFRRDDNDDNNPPSNCGGGPGSGMPQMRFMY